MLKTYDRFTRFYENKHSGRKLNWLFHLCKGDLKTHYLTSSKSGYTFQVSIYQMSILLQYNSSTNYSWEDLQSSTGLNVDVLQGQLGNLIKAKVLLISSGKLGGSASKYELNMDFKNKKIRLNLNLPVKSEQKAETEETHKTVEEDRKLLIQVYFLFYLDSY